MGAFTFQCRRNDVLLGTAPPSLTELMVGATNYGPHSPPHTDGFGPVHSRQFVNS
jgi:hypothetical protein